MLVCYTPPKWCRDGHGEGFTLWGGHYKKFDGILVLGHDFSGHYNRLALISVDIISGVYYSVVSSVSPTIPPVYISDA